VESEGVDDGLQILVPESGQVLEPHAEIDRLAVPGTAVNRNFVPAPGKPPGQFLGEGLESPIAGGNAARAEDRHPHQRLVV
jgi:hypothetical protein